MGISIGSLEIPIPSIIKVFLDEWFGIQGLNPDPTEANIIMKIRLPRVVLAALVGAGLAAAGAGFQGLLKNPLADPYTLGISSGAAVGAVVTLFFGIQLPVIGSFTLPFLSVAAAVVVIFLVLFFARTPFVDLVRFDFNRDHLQFVFGCAYFSHDRFDRR